MQTERAGRGRRGYRGGAAPLATATSLLPAAAPPIRRTATQRQRQQPPPPQQPSPPLAGALSIASAARNVPRGLSVVGKSFRQRDARSLQPGVSFALPSAATMGTPEDTPHHTAAAPHLKERGTRLSLMDHKFEALVPPSAGPSLGGSRGVSFARGLPTAPPGVFFAEAPPPAADAVHMQRSGTRSRQLQSMATGVPAGRGARLPLPRL